MDFTATGTAELTYIFLSKFVKKLLRPVKKFLLLNVLFSLMNFTFVHLAFGGRGTAGKMIVFGLLKREGNVEQKLPLIVPKPHYKGLFRGHIELKSVINDGWAIMIG